MNAVAVVMTVFSVIGALDRIAGNRLGLGKEFEKGLSLFGTLALSMIGMIAVAPLISEALQPALTKMWEAVHVDPSLLMASLFANDMGGAALAKAVAADAEIGRFNGLVVSSMMGGTVSFTIPYALEKVHKNCRESLLMGLLCGVVTIPAGCLIAGLVMKIPVPQLLLNLLPLIVFAAVIAAGLLWFPGACMKIFGLLGKGIQIVITAGLALCIVRYLTGVEIVKGLGTLEDAAAICLNASVVMTGAFPLLKILSWLLKKPMSWLGAAMGVNETSAMGLLSSLAVSMTTFEMMEKMDSKGAMLNSAFCVSAAFVLADHLAFTLAFDASALPGVMVGKLVAGVLAVVLANAVYEIQAKKKAA